VADLAAMCHHSHPVTMHKILAVRIDNKTERPQGKAEHV
jgi:hypothetical protein